MSRLKETVTIKYPNGTYTFKLVKLLHDKKIKQVKFLRDMETTYNTFYRYAAGSIQRVDLDTLDRWCKYLDCSPTDIIEYKRDKE